MTWFGQKRFDSCQTLSDNTAKGHVDIVHCLWGNGQTQL